jgi:hypothetical protein
MECWAYAVSYGGRQMYIERGGSSIADLDEAKKNLKRIRDRTQHLYYAISSLAVLVLPLAVIFAYWLIIKGFPLEILGFAVLLYGFVPLAFLPSFKMRLRNFDEQLEDMDFQIDLREHEVAHHERRAEKLLRINGAQLRRYYDLNLSQNIWIFGLGIACIVLGVALIGVTMYVVVNVADERAKLITGIVGSVGGILTNFVAAIYLKMHAAASSDLTSFHSRLVQTNELLLGNLLASRIADDSKRWDTLAQLAENVSKRGSG